jgi:hypothetical protein
VYGSELQAQREGVRILPERQKVGEKASDKEGEGMKNAIKPSGIPMFCYCVGCRKKIFDLSVLLSFEHKGILCHDCYYKKRGGRK